MFTRMWIIWNVKHDKKYTYVNLKYVITRWGTQFILNVCGNIIIPNLENLKLTEEYNRLPAMIIDTCVT